MCYFVQAITPAGSDINEFQLKKNYVAGRDVWDVQDPVFVTGGRFARVLPAVMLSDGCGRAPHGRDTQTRWKLSESPAD